MFWEVTAILDEANTDKSPVWGLFDQTWSTIINWFLGNLLFQHYLLLSLHHAIPWFTEWQNLLPGDGTQTSYWQSGLAETFSSHTGARVGAELGN